MNKGDRTDKWCAIAYSIAPADQPTDCPLLRSVDPDGAAFWKANVFDTELCLQATSIIVREGIIRFANRFLRKHLLYFHGKSPYSSFPDDFKGEGTPAKYRTGRTQA